MKSRSFSSLFYVAGVFVLAFALPSARSFLGSSVAFFFLQNAHGVLSVVFLKFMGNLVAALPFGLLYGYIISKHTAKSAALFASVAVAFVVWFQVWIGIDSRHWWGTLLDAFFFIVFFSLFAAFTNRFATPPSPHGRKNLRDRPRFSGLTFHSIRTSAIKPRQPVNSHVQHKVARRARETPVKSVRIELVEMRS
jgi:hypothetical protein